MGGYENIKTRLLNWSGQSELNLTLKVIAGALSGALGAAVANPTDLVRIFGARELYCRRENIFVLKGR